MIIAATKFKANCAKLLDWVKQTGQEIIITKRGKRVARLRPADERDLRRELARLRRNQQNPR